MVQQPQTFFRTKNVPLSMHLIFIKPFQILFHSIYLDKGKILPLKFLNYIALKI